MNIYKYLSEETKKELRKSKFNAEDVKSWKDDIADVYDRAMYIECWSMIRYDQQYKVGIDRIRELAVDFASNDIDRFIDYCVCQDRDPNKICIDVWLWLNWNGPIIVFNDYTIEDMIKEGYIVKK